MLHRRSISISQYLNAQIQRSLPGLVLGCHVGAVLDEEPHEIDVMTFWRPMHDRIWVLYLGTYLIYVRRSTVRHCTTSTDSRPPSGSSPLSLLCCATHASSHDAIQQSATLRQERKEECLRLRLVVDGAPHERRKRGDSVLQQSSWTWQSGQSPFSTHTRWRTKNATHSSGAVSTRT
jgi:hypothetical protein